MEKIPFGGWRAMEDTYRTKDGEAYFSFRFYPLSDYYEIDILGMPSYDSYGYRAIDLHTTHRLPSDRGGYRVCFANPMIANDLSSAKKWAGIWAENTWEYIKQGTQFPNTN